MPQRFVHKKAWPQQLRLSNRRSVWLIAAKLHSLPNAPLDHVESPIALPSGEDESSNFLSTEAVEATTLFVTVT